MFRNTICLRTLTRNTRILSSPSLRRPDRFPFRNSRTSRGVARASATSCLRQGVPPPPNRKRDFPRIRANPPPFHRRRPRRVAGHSSRAREPLRMHTQPGLIVILLVNIRKTCWRASTRRAVPSSRGEYVTRARTRVTGCDGRKTARNAGENGPRNTVRTASNHYLPTSTYAYDIDKYDPADR